ncbi:UDP-N-acetylmuramoyl-tripeptide--D-alanyl-D-alanine ligase [Nitratiruptor sp. YY09-18]|uniref:Mur ligase family protein n=1 Tax=Nitratiruptor sp. YY09-18 TaxID=2724901 RepID=UPI001916C9F7|nr:UDP-N-acetylmuramoyl-tripeptide--D-alanyl-D-alanine ligase [Nitratiruptor sp. YY09-18]BCD68294.1 UDP-N-acetylmuramoyl-tripeptide--D-alanyl-D-alanine ligase [Nitratiruptor sp. YY09-18]
MIWLHLIGHIIFVLLLGYYLITNLQWYNYKLSRVILHHHAPWQHILFFLLPFFVYIGLREYIIIFDILFAGALYVWQGGFDKKLVFTARVKRFFMLLLLFTIFFDFIFLIKKLPLFSTLLPLAFALLISNLIERFLFKLYAKEAKQKLDTIDPIVIAITASYGKTSIKNFLAQILSSRFKVYHTPRSVNTIAGIMKDINENLPQDTHVYIVEAGARERGDILEIAQFTQPHYVVIGKIGEQHIEYFKTLENIILTKLELLHSPRLKKAFIWDGIEVKDDPKFVKFGKNIKNVQATLDGIAWQIETKEGTIACKAPVLGAFNALNITAAVLVAHELGMSWDAICKAVANLKSVEHRLQKIEAGGKVIIDDSFNGNLEGMIGSYELVATYVGRKVIVTPGIIESTEEANKKLAKKIDEVFDLVFITGKINREILEQNITKPKIIVEDKSQLQNLLAQHTKPGDLILFSNDTPSFM